MEYVISEINELILVSEWVGLVFSGIGVVYLVGVVIDWIVTGVKC